MNIPYLVHILDFWCMYNLTGMKKSIIRLWHELALSFFVQDLHPSFFFLCLCHIKKRWTWRWEEKEDGREKYFEHSCYHFHFLRQVPKQALIFNRHNKKFFLLFHLASPFRHFQHSNLMRPNKFYSSPKQSPHFFFIESQWMYIRFWNIHLDFYHIVNFYFSDLRNLKFSDMIFLNVQFTFYKENLRR